MRTQQNISWQEFLAVGKKYKSLEVQAVYIEFVSKGDSINVLWLNIILA